jgi:hypothetical protein
MKIEFKNQTLDFDFDINKKYVVAYREVDGKRVDEFSVTPVKGHIKASCDTAEVIFPVNVKTLGKIAKLTMLLDKKNHEGCMKEVS